MHVVGAFGGGVDILPFCEVAQPRILGGIGTCHGVRP